MVRFSRSIFVKLTSAILLAAFFLAGSWVQAATIVEYVTPTPDSSPAGLAFDAQGNLWIVAFQDSLLVKYDPSQNVFTDYELPVINEIPYSLNIDKKRNVVWVTGNQSDTLLSFDIATEAWKVYPLPRQRFFTRDIEISEDDGAVYTTNSHFPTWQSEGGVPTLLRLAPLEEEVIHKAED